MLVVNNVNAVQALRMGRGSFPKFPKGNLDTFPESFHFFIITLVYIRSVSHKAWACR